MFASDAELLAFVSQFEAGTWPSNQWTHATHIAMASYYLLVSNHADASTRIRDGLYRYHLSQGGQHTDTSGFHETLTRFWIERIVGYLEALAPGLSLVQKVNSTTQHFGPQRAMHNHFYSWDVLNDREARKHWRPPDR